LTILDLSLAMLSGGGILLLGVLHEVRKDAWYIVEERDMQDESACRKSGCDE
jgi:hypothetical protein